MSNPWQYRSGIYLGAALAEVARRDPASPAIKPLTDVLTRHNATMKSQYDAFASYVAEAESRGVEQYPLYEWTRATIGVPEKKAKYLQSFTLYVRGDEVYARELAEALETDLQSLVTQSLITRMSKHDTNPAKRSAAAGAFSQAVRRADLRRLLFSAATDTMGAVPRGSGGAIHDRLDQITQSAASNNSVRSR